MLSRHTQGLYVRDTSAFLVLGGKNQKLRRLLHPRQQWGRDGVCVCVRMGEWAGVAGFQPTRTFRVAILDPIRTEKPHLSSQLVHRIADPILDPTLYQWCCNLNISLIDLKQSKLSTDRVEIGSEMPSTCCDPHLILMIARIGESMRSTDLIRSKPGVLEGRVVPYQGEGNEKATYSEETL